MEEKQKEQVQSTGLGLGLFLCGAACMLFPKIALPMPLWLAWLFTGLGFALALLGILGACIEYFGAKKPEQGEESGY
jgi:hypothetical protein